MENYTFKGLTDKRNEYSNIFLIFRIFDHPRNGRYVDDEGVLLQERSTKLFSTIWKLNKYEDMTSKNELYQKYKDQQKDRRAFNHVEIVLPDQEWFGIKNGNKDTVFKKDRLEFMARAELVYPQTVMIKIDMETRKRVYEFVESVIGQPFDSDSLLKNYVLAHYLPLKGLAKFNPAGKWYCSKLVIETLIKSGIIETDELDPLTTTVEELFWWCQKVSKKQEEECNENPPRFYIEKYGKFPEDVIKD